MGYVSDNDLVVTIAALERTLLELGWSFQLGTRYSSCPRIIAGKDEVKMRILVCDPISEKGIEVFKQDPEIEVDVKLNLSEAEICEIIFDYHAVVVRSQTKITKKNLGSWQTIKSSGQSGSRN